MDNYISVTVQTVVICSGRNKRITTDSSSYPWRFKPSSRHGYVFIRGGWGNITATDMFYSWQFNKSNRHGYAFQGTFFYWFSLCTSWNKTYSSFIPDSSRQHNTYIHQTFIYIYHNLFHSQFTYSHRTFIILKLRHQFTSSGGASVYIFRWVIEPSFGIDNLWVQK